ncbi:MAG: hypothetical protein RLZ42_500 [Armatimonadota bacterium]
MILVIQGMAFQRSSVMLGCTLSNRLMNVFPKMLRIFCVVITGIFTGFPDFDS